MVAGRQVVMDAVLDPADPATALSHKVWEKYDAMSAAWRADPGEDKADRKAAAQVLRAAAEDYIAAFLDVATAKDVIPYMHYVAWHFPQWMEEHGCIDHYSAQCMEHCNREVKRGYKLGTNHQQQRTTHTGKVTLSRTGQNLKRSTLLAQHRDMHGPASRAQPHMPKRKADAVKQEQQAAAAKRVKKK